MSALGWIKLEREVLLNETLKADPVCFALYVHIRLIASRGVQNGPRGLMPPESAFLSLNKLAAQWGMARKTLGAKLSVLSAAKLVVFSVSKTGAVVTLVGVTSTPPRSDSEDPKNDENGLSYTTQHLAHMTQHLSHMTQDLEHTTQHIQEEKRRELLPHREQVAADPLRPAKKRKTKPGSVTLEQAIEKSPLFEIWNTHANPGLSRVAGADAKRLEAACARWSENPSREYWQGIMTRLNGSSFLNGKGSTGWKADFDWLVRPASVLRLSEGKYDDRFKTSTPLPDLSLPKRDEKREEREEHERQAFTAWYAESGYSNMVEALAVYNPKIHKATGRSA
jgi:hypothetical protein